MIKVQFIYYDLDYTLKSKLLEFSYDYERTKIIEYSFNEDFFLVTAYIIETDGTLPLNNVSLNYALNTHENYANNYNVYAKPPKELFRLKNETYIFELSPNI